jgi:CheY-like chemotaxis protein
LDLVFITGARTEANELAEVIGGSMKNMNVLIIDDEPVSSAVLKQLVVKLPKCEAHVFMDAAAALIWCAHNVPDLAIVDYAMPTIDGIDFTRRLRAMPQGAKVPIIMVSAVVDTQVVRRALHNGVDDFLHKPFDFVELQTCVSEILGLKAMRGQLANKALLGSARALSRRSDAPRLLDRNLSRARLGGDEQLLAHVAKIFSDTVPPLIGTIHTSIVNSDFDAVLADIISLKGAVAALEAPDVLKLLSRLEEHARNRDTVATVAAFSMVQALTERLLDELTPLIIQRVRVPNTCVQ